MIRRYPWLGGWRIHPTNCGGKFSNLPAVDSASWKLAATMLIAVGLVLVIALAVSAVEQRFPPPEFTETRHELPQPATPAHAHPFWEYLDVAVLAAALALSTYLAVVRRSRLGLILLTIGALIWFGFWRKGCICSIGAIQNITLAAFDPSYSIPFTAVVFFTLPILVTIFFGRTFCAFGLPPRRRSRVGSPQADPGAKLDRSGPGTDPVHLSWRSGAVCRHRHDLPHLQL